MLIPKKILRTTNNTPASILSILRAALVDTIPAVTRIAASSRDPFHVLVSTVISLRTKDAVTADASARLLGDAPTPAMLSHHSEAHIAKAIYPAGFYRTKARQLRAIAVQLIENHNGKVPDNLEALLRLPGVGRKTANLVLGLGFGIPAVCVDTHVHRISNRLGWVATTTPEETERALMQLVPRSLWIDINELLVRFGQTMCTPRSPFCSRCPIFTACPRAGVGTSR